MTWRTMESAPLDGTRVLVLVPGWPVEIAAWMSYGARSHWEDERGEGICDPTHWQPLPSTDLTAPCPVVEARIQGLREGFEIAQEEAYAVERHHIVWDDADAALDAAIAELREGKR